MGIFDTVKCEYLLPNPLHQDIEFQTKDLECFLGHYTITASGRLIRHPSSYDRGPDRDVEWPIHGDIRIYASDPEKERGLVEYRIRFTHGRVEWARRWDEEGELVTEELPASPPAPAAPQGVVPEAWGRLLTVDDFHGYAPEKLELIRGEIPGGEKLLLLLLTQLGLRRAALLVGQERWKKGLAAEEEET